MAVTWWLAGIVGSTTHIGTRDPRAWSLFVVAVVAVSCVMARRGGLGDRFRAGREAEEARRVARGDPVVRLGCAGAMAVVLVVVVAGAVLGALLTD